MKCHEECARTYELFFKPGEVTEIRSFGLNGKGPWEGFAKGAGIVYGYFDNAKDFGMWAEKLENIGPPGIYFTINPVIPDLLARAANRLKAADAKSSSTSDVDILCIRWLPIDLDPVRPSGISSSKEELEEAIKLRNEIYRYFRKKDYEGVLIPACSGNGAHLNVGLPDLDNNKKSIDLVKRALSFLAKNFTNKKVDVDQAVHNPSRIWKLYGTSVRKGDSIPSRPHRKSYVEPGFMDGQTNKQ